MEQPQDTISKGASLTHRWKFHGFSANQAAIMLQTKYVMQTPPWAILQCILGKMGTYFSRAWASEGTEDPFPLAYMLGAETVTHLSSHQGRHWPRHHDDIKKTCQMTASDWLGIFRPSGAPRNRLSKHHMVRTVKTDWPVANYPPS